jgi:hypothetical protein
VFKKKEKLKLLIYHSFTNKKIFNMKKIIISAFFLMSFGISQAQTFKVEIRTNPTNKRELEVVLIPSGLTLPVIVNQIVFSIKWPVNSNVSLGNLMDAASLSALSSGLAKNAGEITEGGYVSQKFARDVTTTLNTLASDYIIARIPIVGGTGNPTFTIPPTNQTPIGDWYILGSNNGNVIDGMQGEIKNSANVVLAVDLLSFQGEKRDKTSVLTWTTVGERNLSNYIIERSGDGVLFMPIGVELARAKSDTEKVVYEYTDTEPVPSINYYRLRMENTDKTFKYSKIVTLDFLEDITIKAYPSPFSTDVTIEIDVPQNSTGDMTVNMVDAKGQVVFTKKIVGAGRKTSFNVRTDDFSSGTYILWIKKGNDVWQQKITKY